jgi:thiamine kinase-like enzyme
MSKDIQQRLDAAIRAVPGWTTDTVEVRPLVGGLMNSNWLARHDGNTYFMKIYGIGSEAFVNRDQSIAAARQAHGLGISPKVLHYDPKTGLEVVEFLTEHRASTNADFARRDFLDAAIDLYAKFHAGAPLESTKDIFQMVDEHLEQGDELGAIRPTDFPWLKKQYQKAKAAFFASGLDLVPCHSDPMPGNFMVRLMDDRITDMQLIDFEFAANNERAYEIAVFLAEVFVDERTSLELIERYYGDVRPEIVARIWVARAVADIKWGSWAVQQRKLSDWDFDYQKYGIWKYARARMLFNDPRWDDWLRMI